MQVNIMNGLTHKLNVYDYFDQTHGGPYGHTLSPESAEPTADQSHPRRAAHTPEQAPVTIVVHGEGCPGVQELQT